MINELYHRIKAGELDFALLQVLMVRAPKLNLVDYTPFNLPRKFHLALHLCSLT